jgi:hypothetical protein
MSEDRNGSGRRILTVGLTGNGKNTFSLQLYHCSAKQIQEYEEDSPETPPPSP